MCVHFSLQQEASQSMAVLFPHTLVLQATSPLSLDHGFRHLQLRPLLHQLRTFETQLASDDFDSAFSYELEKLCHRISTVAGLAGIAIPYNEHTLLVLCQGQQKECVEKILGDSKELLSIEIGEEVHDSIGTGLLMTKALESGLKGVFTHSGWTSLNGNILVHGNIALWDERTPLEAVSMALQLESSNKITFFVSPDVIQFRRFKVQHILSDRMRREFDNGCEVNFKDYMVQQTEESIQDFKCLVLPSMKEGYVIGCSKSLPKDMDLDDADQRWKGKYNMALPNDYFYMRVCLTFEISYEIWIPSCLVLTRAGLIPVPSTTRMSKIICVLDNFNRSVSGWNFFNAGQLKFEASIQPTMQSESYGWTSAKDILKLPTSENDAKEDLKSFVDVFSNLGLQSLKTFRRSKPLLVQSQSSKELNKSSEEEHLKQSTIGILTAENIVVHHTKLVPHFTPYRKIQTKGCPPAGSKNVESVPNSSDKAASHQTKMLITPRFVQRNPCQNPKVVQVQSKKKTTMTSGLSVVVKKDLSKSLQARPTSLDIVLGPFPGSGVTPSFVSNKVPTTHNLPNGITKNQNLNLEDPNKLGTNAEGSIKRKKPSISKTYEKTPGRGKEQNVHNPTKKTKVTEKVQQTPNEAAEGLQRLPAVAISVDGQKFTDPHHVLGNIDEVSKPTEDSSSPAMDIIVKATISSYSQKKSAVAIDPNIIKEKVRNKKANGKLNELTVVELKAFLSASKAKVSGKKEELIQRVIALVC